ncbi:hypothetical protein QZH41_011802, partial [Actinostola sp. cb2023]
EKHEVLRINTWIKQYWNDPRLTWNKTQYKGIERLILEPKRLWLPDVSLLNSATADIGVNGAEARLILQHTGDIAWFNPAILESSCSMDITHFPFDDQLCELRLGSWSFSLPFMDIVPARRTADLSDYVENGEWILQSVIPYRNLKEYDCCEGSYPEVTYELRLRRRALYYIVNFIFPCVLIAVLTLLVFLLPFESGERMSFGVTVLLSFTILILMLMVRKPKNIKNKLPPTSKAIPLIGIYYACTMIEVSLAMFIACLTMRVYCPENSSATLPGWAKEIASPETEMGYRGKPQMGYRGKTEMWGMGYLGKTQMWYRGKTQMEYQGGNMEYRGKHVFIMNYCAKVVGLSKPVERVKQQFVIQTLRQ